MTEQNPASTVGDADSDSSTGDVIEVDQARGTEAAEAAETARVDGADQDFRTEQDSGAEQGAERDSGDGPDPATPADGENELVVVDEKGHDLKWVRRGLLLIWAAAVVWEVQAHGLAIDRTRLILYLAFGMVAATVGRRRAITVLIDWLPFVLILMLYDWTRDVAVWLNMPTQWTLAPDVDHWLFGVNPTAWLQSELKQSKPPWWEVLVSLVYMSYFIIPYATAAVLWIRNRATWRRFAVCFIATSFIGLIGYTLVPAAPPWAASMCTHEQVADHPHDPPCMFKNERVEGNLLGDVNPKHEGAADHVERISWRGWSVLGLGTAGTLIKTGQSKANLVAAIPSLHAGLTMMLALFMWPRTKALGRTLFVGYALAMAFALVYTAEHYVFDILLGWLLAACVVGTVTWVDKRYIQPRNRRRAEEKEAEREQAVAAAVAGAPATG
ncbi:phosphatase PAP2 family protein [Gordonia sp. (in: high G+C Gram-positive bacteria)]|uniref:phosphatase PAP2 family protein n=1 Tax=Gordonia sp. (in: high G+C Gram-positive bacteria) TaxID=84139 RepID=UPI0035295341